MELYQKKNSILYNAADIKLVMPEVKESGHGIVPTSSTTCQLALGDALAIASMEYKKFGKLDFKKFHPSGSLGAKLRTAEDLMLTGNKIPFINEKTNMKKALKLISNKKLGVLIVINKKKLTTGIITDGQIRRSAQKNKTLESKTVKDIMTPNPISIEKNTLAAKALSIMNEKKITCLCVYDSKKRSNTIGIIHIHNILENKIY